MEFAHDRLLVAHVEHHAAHIGLVHRAHDLHHQREPDLAGQLQTIGFLIGRSFLGTGDSRRIEQVVDPVGRKITVAGTVHNTSDAFHIHARELGIGRFHARRIVHLGERIAEEHFVREIDAAVADELLDLALHPAVRGEYREYRFFGGAYLLGQQRIDVVDREKTRRTENHRDAVDLIEIVLARIEDVSELFRRARRQEIDGIAHRRTGKELLQQRSGLRPLDVGNLHLAVGERIGQHDGRTARMGNDRDVAPLELRIHEDSRHRSELLTTVAAHDTRLAEQGIHRNVGAGQRPRVHVRRPRNCPT